MKYLNPITWLEKMNGAALDMSDNAAVTLLRKKMLAELALSEGQVLQVAGEWLNKNDLLQLFDCVQSPAQFSYYQQIKADPVLTNFLETGRITALFIDTPLYKDEAFLAFIAPFYGPLFTTAVLDSIKQREVVTLQYLFANPLLLDAEYMKTSFDSIFHLLREQYQQVEQAKAILEKNNRYNWKTVLPYLDHIQVQLLNALPGNFQEFRSDYGILMINFALLLNRLNRSTAAAEILHEVSSLKTITYVQEQLAMYLPQVEEKAGKSVTWGFILDSWLGRKLGQMGKPTEWGIKIGVLVLIVLIFVLGALFEKPRKLPPDIATFEQSSDFDGSRTYHTMKYVVAALEKEARKAKLPLEERMADSIQTGDDPYGPAFMDAVRRQGNEGATFVLPAFDHNLTQLPEDSDMAYQDPQHRQSVCVFNRVSLSGIVALVQTPDSFYSRYVAEGDSVFLPLPLSLSRIYFYVGTGWDPQRTVRKGMEKVPAYHLRGSFVLSLYNSSTFLRRSCLQFNLDTTYWKTSNRYIPIEVRLFQGQRLQLKQLSDNSNGMEMYEGE
ncbi:hypothetical protein FHW36_108191 [Chitinophaga polysaccharea]|uniref:Uncharacterized protein n=1 Tax=Chitinophaga polysaccharea TaxID=1293035 RepID=A0A561PCJ1_9BACT|nr:hypothetical protein [Chitinophaga polysaccharea]TWF35835.1 hypothetical protein FHW36_108191 [Chitinophaga polysaccharea]